MWLRMGSFGPVRVATADGTRDRPAALPPGRQSVHAARQDRPGLHRYAGQRLRSDHRGGHAQGLLGRRPRRRRLRAVHPALHHQLQPLELAAFSLRRIVRHDALGRAREGLARRGHRAQRRRLALVVPELESRLQRRRADRRRRLGLRALPADRDGDGVVPSTRCAARRRSTSCFRKSRTSRSASTSTRSGRAHSSPRIATTTSSPSCTATPGSRSSTSATRTCAFRTTASKAS